MKLKFIPVVVAVITAFLVASCERTDEEMGNVPSSKTTITLNIETSSEVTRATQAEENTIKTLTAYVFVAGGKLAAGTWVPTTTRITASGTSTTAMITVDPAYAFTAANNKVDIYLVANATPLQLPNNNTAKAAFMNGTTSGFNNNATGDNFPGLVAVSYVATQTITPNTNANITSAIVLSRVQARVFVSNTKVVGDNANELKGYTVGFSGLSDKAVITNPIIANFTGVGGGGTYQYTVKGNNGNTDFYNQEPVGYFYPTPTNRTVTVTVKSPNNTATKTATFTLASGKNYRVKITPGTTNATLSVAVELWKGEEKKERYMVVVVAGQSNSVGYDESLAYPEGIDKSDPNAFQLAYRYGGNNLDIVPLKWCSDNLQDMSGFKNGPTVTAIKGTKGVHLPLAKELLKAGRIPKGYKVIVIPVAYGATSLVAGNLGTYNSTLMRPDNMTGALRWGAGSAYIKTVIDRTKYALNLNPDNKFLGVVWCQGEHDATRSSTQFEAFKAMTQEFFTAINVAHANRCPKGIADKDLWYNYSSTSYWSNWYAAGQYSSATFGGYKVWNPNTFIHVPSTTATNQTNGNGATSSARTSHFGNNAFSETIAPMIVQCMDNNGGLFNGKQSVGSNRFVETDIKGNAATLGGTYGDADVQTGLRYFYSFASNATYTQYNAANSVATVSGGMTVVDSKDLVNVNGVSFTKKVLNITPTGGSLRIKCASSPVTASWSVAFLIKRTLSGSLTAAIQPIIHGLGVNSPFIGYKTYTASATDEVVGGNVEFVVERNLTTDRTKAVPGQFFEADNVRAMDQWIFYVLTFDSGTNNLCIYANGQRINQKMITGLNATDFSDIYIGTSSQYLTTMSATMANFGLWNKVLTEATIKKLYLLGYYGYTK